MEQLSWLGDKISFSVILGPEVSAALCSFFLFIFVSILLCLKGSFVVSFFLCFVYLHIISTLRAGCVYLK